MSKHLTYKDAGVDIDSADAAKREMASNIVSLSTDKRVLNRPGAFASLFAADFPGVAEPVLVLKAEEPGSKQLLAFQHGRVREICFDLINHLVNDIAVMGAQPLAVLDTIICGGIKKDIVVQLVTGMGEACRENDCTLVGGETSEQPGVLLLDRYVLCASVVGVVDKTKIIDGSKICVDDVVIALAANGPHTNGYTLIRKLLADDPQLAEQPVGDQTFLDAVMRPHRAYFKLLKPLFAKYQIKGLAHITGGGVQGNLNRILPPGVSAAIDLSALRVPAIFAAIRAAGGVPDADMLRTFNMGVGIALVAEKQIAENICIELNTHGCEAYPIGRITPGNQEVEFEGCLGWN